MHRADANYIYASIFDNEKTLLDEIILKLNII